MADILRIQDRFDITGRGLVYTVKYNKGAIIRIGDLFYDLQGHRFKVKGILTSKEVQFIKQLLSNGELCQYIVKNSLSNFGAVIVQLPLVEKELVMSNINHGYAEATGYMQFANYDIFGNIAYYVYNHSKEIEIKKISKDILEGCARYRWNMQSLFEKVLSDEI